ncbi:MAG: malonyl-ACP O-methyltransferase BioC [Bacillota bacterium]
MIEKEVVKQNFSRAATTYEQYATVQREMADNLEQYLPASEEVDSILEIGAGTGLFTDLIVDRFREDNYWLVDISPAMIAKCKEKFKDYEQLNYLVADGEELKLEQRFDLIVSNATLQWFNDLERGLLNLRKLLNPAGEFHFSTFGVDTFCELRSSLAQLDGAYDYSQSFVSVAELKEMASQQFSQVEIREEKYHQYFDRVRDFLRATKKLGANSARADKPLLTPAKLRELEANYRADYSQGEQIVVTNHLLYVSLKK